MSPPWQWSAHTYLVFWRGEIENRRDARLRVLDWMRAFEFSVMWLGNIQSYNHQMLVHLRTVNRMPSKALAQLQIIDLTCPKLLMIPSRDTRSFENSQLHASKNSYTTPNSRSYSSLTLNRTLTRLSSTRQLWCLQKLSHSSRFSLSHFINSQSCPQ